MSERTRILVADDELGIRRFLRAGLDPNLYQTIDAENGTTAMRMVATESPDLVLLDLGLPDVDGVDVVKSLREWSRVPIIVVSARESEGDKISALDAGADDYLTKPFSIGELLARIRAAMRRRPEANVDPPLLEFSDVSVDLAQRRITKSGAEVHLTPNEYKLLAVLVRHAGRVVTHRQLLRDVWGEAYLDETHYLRVYMAQLRQKLEDVPAQPKWLLSEPGVGYRLRLE